MNFAVAAPPRPLRKRAPPITALSRPVLNGGMNMAEFYVEANSFAAPFFSDTSHAYVEAKTPAQALEQFAADYSHPCGLYAATVYSSADARNKGEKPLARWLSNQARQLQGVTGSIRMDAPGKGEINGEPVEIKDPKVGRVVSE